MSAMGIRGVERVSFVDYPGQICTTVFYGGCNMRCGFCHNPLLVTEAGAWSTVDRVQLLKQLGQRRKLVPAVCISGGEPTLDPGLPDLVQEIRALGLKIKLDTNGTRPGVLARLLADGLLDYVALDVKAPGEKYSVVSGVAATVAVRDSIELVKEKAPAYEFRTTVVPGLLDKADLMALGRELAGAKKYVLQQFRSIGPLLDPSLERRPPYPDEFLHQVAAQLKLYVATVEVRC